MYTITLHDGTKLENLELNGNNFIAEGVIEDSVFEDNLATVAINDGTTTQSYTDMFLVCNRVENGRSWIVLAEKSEQQKAEEARDRTIEGLRQAMAVLLTGKDV